MGSPEDYESDVSELKASDSDGSAVGSATPWRIIAPEEMPQPSGALEVTAALSPAKSCHCNFQALIGGCHWNLAVTCPFLESATAALASACSPESSTVAVQPLQEAPEADVL